MAAAAAQGADMTYLITFLEGLLSFLSPCLLPMLPVYLSYFAGRGEEGRAIWRILAFVLGFTLSFMVLGLAMSALGGLLSRHRRWVELVCGALMILFGLSCLELLPLRLPSAGGGRFPVGSAASAFLFGLIYPVNLTPCVGAFLGSALALAASSASAGRGAMLLLVYSLGLGLPFVLSGLIMSRLEQLFAKIKSRYAVVKGISGGLLILAGILTAAGLMSRLMTVLV